MILYPEVQAQAHREIDEVVGERLPEWTDRSNMPYLRRCVEEALRCKYRDAGTITHGLTMEKGNPPL